jgi:hypothetical protein
MTWDVRWEEQELPLEAGRAATLVETFLGRQDRRDLDAAVDNAAKQILLDAGIRRAGQRIRVNRGRHTGYEGTIETINWSEAEVRCKGNPRWFSLWHDQAYFTVLNPSQAPPPRAAAFERLSGPPSAPTATPEEPLDAEKPPAGS